MRHGDALTFLASGLLLGGVALATVACSEPADGPACGLPPSTPADVPEFDGNCAGVVPPSFAELQEGFLCHCTGCHSSEVTGGKRGGAPSGLNYDTHEAAKVGALLGAANVRQRLMPYPDGEGPTNAERNLFYQWALCGMPE